MADRHLIDGRWLYEAYRDIKREKFRGWDMEEWDNLPPGEREEWIETAKLVNTHFKPTIDLLEAQRDCAVFEADELAGYNT